MRTDSDEGGLAEAFGLAGGCAVVVAAALVAAAVVAPGHFAPRVLIMAIAVGVVTAVLADWRACAGVAVVAALIFVGFLVHRDGDLTGSAGAWPYTLVIGLAALLGRSARRLHAARRVLLTRRSAPGVRVAQPR